MATDSSLQRQRELLQYVAAIHEHNSGHRKDLSVEAMAADLNRIASRKNVNDKRKLENIGFTPRSVQDSYLTEATIRSDAQRDTAIINSSIAGNDGSRHSGSEARRS